MKSGTRPVSRIPRTKFHHKMGVHSEMLGATAIQDFNLDKGLWMPDQVADSAPTECTGYGVSDVISDLTGQLQSPDFSFAAAQWVEGVTPNTGGADGHDAMQGAVIRGTLPKTAATFSAKTIGELYCANMQNWNLVQSLALKNVQNGALNALGYDAPFDSILNTMLVSKISVCVVTPWYANWFDAPNGIVPEVDFSQDTSQLPWHFWNIKGTKSGRLVGKVWAGDKIGDKGWLYYSSQTINNVLSLPGTAAMVFSPKLSRFVSVAQDMLNGMNNGAISRFWPYWYV